MFWKIMKFEWRMLRADRTAALVTTLFILLAGNALWQGMSGIKQQQSAAREFTRAQDAAIARARRAVEENEARAKSEMPAPTTIGPRHPVSVLVRLTEFQVSLPPLSLALLGSENDELYPTTYKYRLSDGDFVPSLPTGEARSLGGLLPERPVENPLKLMLGRFDLGFVMLYLFPLVILALSFNLLAAERESGTLALLLSQPLQLRTLLFGKLAVRAALVFVVAVLLPALAIYATQKIIVLETNLARLLLWILAVNGYGAFWFGLAAWSNMRHPGASRNALTLFLGWLLIAIMIPALGSLLAQTLFPMPAGTAIAEAERAARFEADSSVTGPVLRHLEEMGKRYPIIEGKEETMERYRQAVYTDLIEVPSASEALNRFMRQHSEIPRHITSAQLRLIGRQARDEFIEEKLAPLLAIRHERQRQQRRLITVVSLFSPTLVLQITVSGIAGTDRTRHSLFLAQVDRHIRGIHDLLLPRIYRNESVRAANLERVRAFEFKEETNAMLTRRLIPEIAILAGLPLLMILLVSRALRSFSAIA
jgi:ABC-2 type transport system permease protein